MHAEVISVGTEMTTGATLDTNSQWLSLELAAIGIPVHFHTTVADDLDAMADVIRTAARRCDLIILTGGLGPTLDDLTRQALAAVLGTELVLDHGSLDFIRSLFARHNREMPERNQIQACFPAGSEPIPNLRGTAPGIWARIPRPAPNSPCTIAALPGVPSEMKRMFLKEVVPRLPGGNLVIQRARINCFGVGESKAEEMLGDLTARGRDPEIGITVHEATITLRIVAHAKSAEECQAKIEVAKSQIRERMGSLVFGEEDEQLEHVVVRRLREKGKTVATVEIGTGGLLARWITEVPDYQTRFAGGIIAPTTQALKSALNMPAETAEDETEALTAAGLAVRQRFAADFVLLVGEFPPYNQEDTTQSAPKSQIGLISDRASRLVDYTFLGDPALNKSRAAKVALNLLRLDLSRS